MHHRPCLQSLAIGLRSLGLGKSTVKEKKTIQSGANSLPGITACDSKSHLAAQHEGEGSSHGADGEDSQQSPPDESRNTTEADVQEAQGEQLDEDVVSQVLAEDSIGPEITGVTGDDGVRGCLGRQRPIARRGLQSITTRISRGWGKVIPESSGIEAGHGWVEFGMMRFRDLGRRGRCPWSSALTLN